MTEKLYETNPHMTFCQAEVVSCSEAEKGTFKTVLNRTVLFPEGGGQLCDRGTIDGEPVIQVAEQGGDAYHFTKRKFEPGEQVRVVLDEEWRRDNSQQHTGEHILSFSFWKLFGAKNVGFHMNEETVTIDLDTELTDEQIAEAEAYANREIWLDKPVNILYRMDNDLSDLPMRKTTEKVKGMLRIVVIPDGDACTCCGTHTDRTGGVGIIKILKTERHRGGMRIECACGRRAFNAVRAEHDLVSGLMRELSTGSDNILPSVRKAKEDLKNTAMLLHRTSAKLMDYVAAEAVENGIEKNGVTVICVAQEVTQTEAKQLLTRLTADEGRLAAVLYPEGEKIFYMSSKSADVKFSCRNVASLINGLFNAKGGGRDDMVQGAGIKTKDWRELAVMLSDSLVKML